jgi:hypothetical protein
MAHPEAASVREWTGALGLPGLVDVHTHFLPPPVMSKVRAQFDAAGPLIGRPWPLHYRGDDDERVEQLRALGVRRFSALPYAHRPGIAAYLNAWAAELASVVPECLRSATFFPEEGVEEYVDTLVAAGTEVFKVHVQVGDFDLTDPMLDAAWGIIAEAGTPVVIHASSGPIPNEHTGPEPMRALLKRHPRLTAVVAHMGAPEYAEFLEIAEEHERVHLDTTMRSPTSSRRWRRSRATCSRGCATCSGRCCSAPTSRTSRIPTRTSSAAWSRWGWGRTGCARSAGRTLSRSSAPVGRAPWRCRCARSPCAW